ncbi:MAG: HEAT repeat domain-containing protein [Holophaga sp.]|nr:HEAT repeat domain-containing protein [Holophaga sp.]
MKDLFDSHPEPDPVAPGQSDRSRALIKALGAALADADTSATFIDHSGHVAEAMELLQGLLITQAEVTLDSGIWEADLNSGLSDPDALSFQKSLGIHSVGTLAFLRGISGAHLEVLLEGMAHSPASLEHQGGLRGYLERRYIQTVHLRGAGSTTGRMPDHLILNARAAISKALAPPDAHSWGAAGWLHYVADLRDLGPMAFQLGFGSEPPDEAPLDLLRQILVELSPEQFISVARGLSGLPRSPAGLTLAFQQLVPELLPAAIDRLLQRDLRWLMLHHPVEDLTAAYTGPLSALVEPLQQGLARAKGEPLVKRFLDDIVWRAQTLKQQLSNTQTASEFLVLPVEARVQLLERALKAHRMDALTELLGYMGEHATANSGATNLANLQTVQAFLPLASQRTVPDYVVDCLEGIVISAFEADPEANSSALTRATILQTIRVRLLRYQPERLEHLLRVLESAEESKQTIYLLSVPLSWARSEIESEEYLDLALECLFQGERSESFNACAAYFAYLGDALLHRVVWRLGREGDRNHRDRMMRVLLAGGEKAEGVIHCMLRPAMPWYHARNLLMVLATVGTARSLQRLPAFLDHEDGRVRVVALRALRHCSKGKVPLAHLVARLEDPEEAIRQEATQILGTLRTSEAIRALTSLAMDRQVPLATRQAAIEALGGTLLAEAAAPLVNLAGSSGSFLRRGEPDGIRLAAARALVGLPSGKVALNKIILGEGRGPLAQSFTQILKG